MSTDWITCPRCNEIDGDVALCDAHRTFGKHPTLTLEDLPTEGTRIGVGTPGGKWHIANGNPPRALCNYSVTLTGQTEVRDTTTMTRDDLCLRCFNRGWAS